MQKFTMTAPSDIDRIQKGDLLELQEVIELEEGKIYVTMTEYGAQLMRATKVNGRVGFHNLWFAVSSIVGKVKAVIIET